MLNAIDDSLPIDYLQRGKSKLYGRKRPDEDVGNFSKLKPDFAEKGNFENRNFGRVEGDRADNGSGARRPFRDADGGSSGFKPNWNNREGNQVRSFEPRGEGGEGRPSFRKDFGGEHKPFNNGDRSDRSWKPAFKTNGFGGEQRKPFFNSNNGGGDRPWKAKGNDLSGERRPFFSNKDDGGKSIDFGGERKPYFNNGGRRDDKPWNVVRKPFDNARFGSGDRKPYIKRDKPEDKARYPTSDKDCRMIIAKHAEINERILYCPDTFATNLLHTPKESVKDVDGCEADPVVAVAMNGLGLAELTPIQSAALAEDKPFRVLAAEQGAGKTLAYLLPLCRTLKAEEASNGDAACGSPRALIVCPTVDTRDQAFRAAKSLSHHIKLRVALLPEMPPKGHQLPIDAKARFEGDRPVDVAVGTTAQALFHLGNGLLNGKHIGHLVVDEADLVVTGHAFRTTQFNAVMAGLKGLKSACFATSVLTKALRESLDAQKEIQPLAELSSPKLHMLPIGSSSFHFHPVNAFGDGKQQACLKILKDAGPKDRFVLFVNRPEAGSVLQAYLRETLPADVPPPVLIHSFVPEQQRSTAIQRFLDASAEDGIEPPRHLICTDWALRGLNTPAGVNILIYDLPKNLPELIHRAGQAYPPAPGQKKRKVHALVSGSDRWLAEYVRLMIRNKQRLGTPLPPQSAEKKFELEEEEDQYENEEGEDEVEIPLNIN